MVIGGVTTGPYLWTGSIATGVIVNDTLPVNYIVGAGVTSICAYTAFPGDTVPANDTSCTNVFGVPTVSISYCDNFDDGNPLWQSSLGINASTNQLGDAGSNWELGTPNYGATNTPHSPPFSWDVNLNSVYTNDAYTDLTSPFFDFGGQDSVKLSFWQNWEAETGWDGTRLDYSSDGGQTWNVLGTGTQAVTDPLGSNWYNTFGGTINSTQLNAWTNSSNGWVKCTYKLGGVPDLNSPTGLVQFRFNFSSDASVTLPHSGASIDNFSLKVNCPTDASISSITQPNANLPAGAVSGVVVTLTNEGDVALDTVQISYVIQPGGTLVNFTYTGGLIQPGGSTLVVLPGMIVPSGAYTLTAYTNLGSDCEHCNDSAYVSLVGIPTLPITYCDDFESGNVGWTTSIAPTFDAGTIWQLGTPNNGATTGAHSGTTAWDVNLASGYGNNANTTLTSPYFDMDSAVNCVLSFWQNYNTDNNADGMRVEYSLNAGTSWSVLGTAPTDPNAVNWYNSTTLNSSTLSGWSGNSNGWKKCSYYLGTVLGFAPPPAAKVQFRFIFTSDFFQNTTADGYSIDDFCVIQPPPNDLGISTIISPSGSVPGNDTICPVVVLHNYGTNTQTSVSIVYSLNGIPQAPYAWTGSLAPGASVNVSLSNCFVSPTGPFTVCAYTSWVGDQDNSNDTICNDIIGVPTIAVTYINGYTDNFDTTFTIWTSGLGANGNPGTNWEWGTPNFGATNSAHSAPYAWDINLNTVYTGNAEAYLYTPYFNFSNAADPIVRFWQNFNTEQAFDGTNFQYSFDGINWNIVQGDPNEINWYTNTPIAFNGDSAWAGNSGGWVQSEFHLGVIPNMSNANTIVQFRFKFASDASVQVDGESIDDFEIEVPIPLDVTPVTLSNIPANQLIFPGQTVSFASYIKNRGTAPLTQVTATLYEGTNIVSADLYTLSPVLQKKDSALHTFSNGWVATPGLHCFTVITSLPNSLQDLNPANDTIHFCITVFDTVNAYPYCNDFENDPRWVTLNSNDYSPRQNWDLGLPSQSFLNGPHSGVSAWTLNTTQNYSNADQSSLFSPRFTVSVNKCYKLTFWHQFKTERYADGGAVEYSLNNGSTWNNIDFANTPNSSLYNYAYTTALSISGPVKGWTGTSAGWLYGEKILRPNVNGHMIIRWKFAADFDSTQEGWTVDDVCFSDIGFCAPIGVEELNGQGFELAQNYPNPFSSLTTFEFILPEDGVSLLYISDVMGKVVAIPVQDKLQAGKYSLNYDASSLAAGIYYYTLEYNNQKITKKMVITH